jgi:hypothetical protein
MCFGWLNTGKDGWYVGQNASGELEAEVVFSTGNHAVSFDRIVPEGEKETELVLRNYHLGTPGQTTFTLKRIQMRIEKPSNGEEGKAPITNVLKSVKFESTRAALNFIEGTDGSYSLTTNNDIATRLATTQRLRVNPGDKLSVEGDLEIKGDDLMCLGWLNTARQGYYSKKNSSGQNEDRILLKAGQSTICFDRTVPEGETETSLVLSKRLLGTTGQTTIALNNFKVKIDKLNNTEGKVLRSTRGTIENPKEINCFIASEGGIANGYKKNTQPGNDTLATYYALETLSTVNEGEVFSFPTGEKLLLSINGNEYFTEPQRLELQHTQWKSLYDSSEAIVPAVLVSQAPPVWEIDLSKTSLSQKLPSFTLTKVE